MASSSTAEKVRREVALPWNEARGGVGGEGGNGGEAWLEDPETSPLVIDSGISSIRAGLCSGGGGADSMVKFPPVVGRPRLPGIMPGMGEKDIFVGHEAVSKRGILTLKSPLEGTGVVTDWDLAEKLFGHAVQQASAADSPHADLRFHAPVLMSEPADNPRANREKTAQVMFETFERSSLSLFARPLLAMYATGDPSMTGTVVSIGDNTFSTFNCVNGSVYGRHLRQDFGGRDATDYLMKIFCERGYAFITTAEREIVKDIKEKLAYVALDLEQEMADGARNGVNSSCERNYELPDGQVITAGNERFRCLEPFFQPAFVGISAAGIHDQVYNAIMSTSWDHNDEPSSKADVAENQRTLFSNIVCSGATTRAPGFAERLQSEVERLAPSSAQVRVSSYASDDMAYIGGLMTASSSGFAGAGLTSEQYYEEGPSAIHARCPGLSLAGLSSTGIKAARKS